MNEDLRQKLEKEKAELEQQLADLEKRSIDYGSDVDGGDEESHETDESGLKFSIEQSLKKRLQEIEDELSRL